MPLWDMNSVALAFHDAALDPEGWPAALDLLSAQTASLGAVLLPVRSRSTLSIQSASLGEATEFYFDQGWSAHDKRDAGAFRLANHGIVVDFDITTEDQIRRDPYYQDFLGRFGLKWFAGVGISAGDDLWCLSIQRSERQGPFTPDEQAALLRLREPLSSATTLANAIGSARTQGLISGLEIAGMPALLVDREAKVLHLNGSAEALLGQDLRIRQGRIVSTDPVQTDRIRRTIGLALGLTSEATVPAPLAIERRGHRPLVLRAIPIGRHAHRIFAPANALILLRDLDDERIPPGSEMQALFGLTPAETKIALFLMKDGSSLTDAAGHHGISVATARTHLASVFRKTDTRGQSELLRLLSRIGAPTGERI